MKEEYKMADTNNFKDTVGQIEMYFHAYYSNWDNLFKNENLAS